MPDDLVRSGGRKLMGALEGMAFGTVTLVVHVRAGKPCRVEVVRAESIENAPMEEEPELDFGDLPPEGAT